MYINIAANLVVMTQNTNYRSVWVNDAHGLRDHTNSPYDPINQAASSMCGPGHWDKAPIFAVQIAKNSLGAGFVRLWLHNTPALAPIDVPYAAFVAGRVYHMYVDKYTVVDAGGAEVDAGATFQMIGHLCYAYPIDLN